MQKLGYPRRVVYADTLPIRLDKLHLWKRWGPEIVRHYLDSPILRYDTIQLLDFLKANRN